MGLPGLGTEPLLEGDGKVWKFVMTVTALQMHLVPLI